MALLTPLSRNSSPWVNYKNGYRDFVEDGEVPAPRTLPPRLRFNRNWPVFNEAALRVSERVEPAGCAGTRFRPCLRVPHRVSKPPPTSGLDVLSGVGRSSNEITKLARPLIYFLIPARAEVWNSRFGLWYRR